MMPQNPSDQLRFLFQPLQKPGTGNAMPGVGKRQKNFNNLEEKCRSGYRLADIMHQSKLKQFRPLTFTQTAITVDIRPNPHDMSLFRFAQSAELCLYRLRQSCNRIFPLASLQFWKQNLFELPDPIYNSLKQASQHCNHLNLAGQSFCNRSAVCFSRPWSVG